MSKNKLVRVLRRGCIGVLIGSLVAILGWTFLDRAPTPVASAAGPAPHGFSVQVPAAPPGPATGAVAALADLPPADRLCRFGLDALTDVTPYPLNALRLGWYLDWATAVQPVRPGGISYLQMITFKQTGPNAYSASLSGSALANTLASNPHATWVLGNEPDSPAQDNMDPQLYAQAYHDYYYLIKGIDPGAQIAIAAVVQPTPLRMQYLDLVLSSYRTRYHQPLPVDIWSIHGFILNEVSCSYDPGNCWGALIPRGVNANYGQRIRIDQNADSAMFMTLIPPFRQWMASRGYQDRPLIITEFGVQMPPDYGFPPDLVNRYMTDTFNYLSSAGGSTGYPADNYHYVQRWAWYSLADTSLNGWLFDPATKARTSTGDNFAAYTARINPQVNLAATRVWADPLPVVPPGGSATLTLHARVVNNGDMPITGAIMVRFYDGDPAQGGQPIGADQAIAGLDGCASIGTVQLNWSNVPAGAHRVYAVADPTNQVTESTKADNTGAGTVLVPTYRLYLPSMAKETP